MSIRTDGGEPQGQAYLAIIQGVVIALQVKTLINIPVCRREHQAAKRIGGSRGEEGHLRISCVGRGGDLHVGAGLAGEAHPHPCDMASGGIGFGNSHIITGLQRTPAVWLTAAGGIDGKGNTGGVFVAVGVGGAGCFRIDCVARSTDQGQSNCFIVLSL